MTRKNYRMMLEHVQFLAMFFGGGFLLVAGLGACLKLSIGAFDLLMGWVSFLFHSAGRLIGLLS